VQYGRVKLEYSDVNCPEKYFPESFPCGKFLEIFRKFSEEPEK